MDSFEHTPRCMECGHIADECLCDNEGATVEGLPEKPSMYSVAVFLVDKAYGGPEEGGWYYDCGALCDAPHQLDAPGLEPMDLLPKFYTFDKRFEAVEWARKVNAALDAGENNDRPRIDSVLSEGRYRAIVNPGMPHDFPVEIPHYE